MKRCIPPRKQTGPKISMNGAMHGIGVIYILPQATCIMHAHVCVHF